MKTSTGKRVQKVRIFVQVFFVFLFFYLLLSAGQVGTNSFTYSDYFFYFDPLLLLLNFIATSTIITIFLLALIPLVLTFIFGRFFCGWICPFGAINQFFSWIFKKSKKEKKGVDKKLLKLKYLILIMVIVSALLGTHYGGWLDPFSLLTRSVTTVVNPSVNYVLEETLKKGAQDEGVIAKGLKPIYNFSKEKILAVKQRAYSQTWIIGGLFLFFLIMNLYKRRFYCNYICPLGALYAIGAKFSILNLKANEKCISCKRCARNCTYNGSPFEDYLKTDCVVCFNCVSDSPGDTINVSFEMPGKKNRTRIDLGRRKIIGSIVLGLSFGALFKIAASAKSKFHGFLRPPGSVPEKEFLKKCIRCGECMQVCPTNYIQPALFEAGVEGMWTPVLNAQTGYCEYTCNKCTQVCPTKAIKKLDVAEKQKFKMGTAVIDRSRCYTYADGYDCAVCEEHCPIPEKAIRFREVTTWNYEGKQVNVKQIYVVPDLCTGCGNCQHVCPRTDAPGILVSAEEEQREALSF
ncbi:MAG: 4Fe-4S binding protein [Acidobacteria bacterium]|jgi:MauM/NapG family ferredoxin protein|nr:4Fe-4S binding protein [Acidobacteriota bacterium]